MKSSFLFRATETPEAFFRCMVLLSGLLLILGGVFWCGYNFYRLLTFEKIDGKVASVGVSRNVGKMPARIYDIWVSFNPPKRIGYANVGKSVFYSPYEKGDAVTVYYDPQNPNEAIINTFGTLWFTPTVVLLIPGLALVGWVSSKTLRTKKSNHKKV